MKRALKSPVFNAVCLCLFTAFYSLIFIGASGHEGFEKILYYSRYAEERQSQISGHAFLVNWSRFLADGSQKYIALVLIALTIVVVILLLSRRKPYDEYHVDRLVSCLVIAFILTMIAIALFYISVLSVSDGIVESFTLFIVIHWATVIFADLVYVLLCRWR